MFCIKVQRAGRADPGQESSHSRCKEKGDVVAKLITACYINKIYILEVLENCLNKKCDRIVDGKEKKKDF